MKEKLEDLARKIKIGDIAKMNSLEKFKYYAFDWAFNIVWWPGFIGGPVGTFASAAMLSRYPDSSYQDINKSTFFILGTFVGGAAIASAARVGCNIARDYAKIKKIKDGTYEAKKVRG